jgi:hypothetical protein
MRVCLCVLLCQPASYQVGIFQVLYLGRSPDEAHAPLAAQGPYMPFRDASCGIPTFNLQPIDCIRVSEQQGQVGSSASGARKCSGVSHEAVVAVAAASPLTDTR